MAMPGNIFGCHNKGRVLLAFSEYRPGILLTILQSTGQGYPTKSYLVQNVSSIEVEKPWFRPTGVQCWLSALTGV